MILFYLHGKTINLFILIFLHSKCMYLRCVLIFILFILIMCLTVKIEQGVSKDLFRQNKLNRKGKKEGDFMGVKFLQSYHTLY